MYAWEQIQQTVDYIDKHLGEELAIDNLAGNGLTVTFLLPETV